MRAVPDAAVALVKRFEGLRLEPYRDAAGFWTVGWGHLIGRDRRAPRPPPIDEDQAGALLVADLARTAAAVLRLARVPLTDGQFGALVSFAFNVGAGNLQASTLLRLVNREEHDDVPPQFRRWTHAGGVKLPGLVRRRAAEAAMYAPS
ncbi:MAG: lysozyme [Rhodospirillales bacterium]|nr:lysozyme [Rhodospirillales bacterium]